MTNGLKILAESLKCFYFRKGDVMNLLESAGFSRSNPYYIVKQGKVCTFILFCEIYNFIGKSFAIGYYVCIPYNR